MSVSYLQYQKKRIRVTLDLEVYDDFHPHQINWSKVFQLEGDETVNVYVEDRDIDW
jgi:hypothetical protein